MTAIAWESEPHLEAERQVLGAMMWTRPDREYALKALTGDEFTTRGHAAIFEAVAALYGSDPEARITPDETVAQLRQVGMLGMVGGEQYVREIEQGHLTYRIQTACSILIEKHLRSRLWDSLVQASEMLRNEPVPTGNLYGGSATRDPSDLYAEVLSVVERGKPAVMAEAQQTLADLIELDPQPRPWLIPRVLRRQDRLLIVAAEGLGKTTLAHQLAVQISQGCHPFRTETVEPQRALLIDLENDPALRMVGFRRMLHAAEREAPETFNPANVVTQFPQRSLDLTDRRDQLWLDQQIEAARPTIVSLGPLYRLHFGDGREATTVQALADVLDRLRITYDCAFVLEAHAPHESFRKKDASPLRPTGSRAWIYWSDMVKTLTETDNGQVEVGEARGDREFGRHWPGHLRRGDTDQWPWLP